MVIRVRFHPILIRSALFGIQMVQICTRRLVLVSIALITALSTHVLRAVSLLSFMPKSLPFLGDAEFI